MNSIWASFWTGLCMGCWWCKCVSDTVHLWSERHSMILSIIFRHLLCCLSEWPNDSQIFGLRFISSGLVAVDLASTRWFCHVCLGIWKCRWSESSTSWVVQCSIYDSYRFVFLPYFIGFALILSLAISELHCSVFLCNPYLHPFRKKSLDTWRSGCGMLVSNYIASRLFDFEIFK